MDANFTILTTQSDFAINQEQYSFEVNNISNYLTIDQTEVVFLIQNPNVSFSVLQAVPVEITVSPMGERGLQGVQGAMGDIPEYVAGEALNSHQPIALVGGLAYKMNYLNPLHQFAFVGFSKTSAIISGVITIETNKIELAGWGLVPNQIYLVGANGGLITANNTASSFTKIVGFAQTSTSLLIVKDYSSINKN